MIIPATNAWEITNGNVTNMTEADLLNFAITMRAGGVGMSQGLYASTMYNVNALTYTQYYQAIDSSNRVIRDYNMVLEDHFNQTTVNTLRLMEFNL